MTAGLAVLLAVNGDRLATRFADLFASGGADAERLALWEAARRMIADSPWLGLGLGTFQTAYPLYAQHPFPLVMDKALNDYLELAAGLGLPAAIALWSAIALFALRCARAVFVRHRNRQFAILGVGATVLVAVHSAADMSLQIPAVAATFAAILGLGVAQSFPSREL